MKAKLTSPGRPPVELEDGGAVTIGRDPATSTIVLGEDTRVSKLHARVFHEADRWFVEDLGSRNGTFVNDRRVVARITLRHLDLIVIGGTELQFNLTPGEPSEVEAGKAGASFILASLDAGVRPQLLRGASTPQADFRDPHVRLKLLYVLGEKLTRIRSTRTLFAELLSEVFRILPVDRGVVLCRTPEGSLEVAAQASRISQDDDEIRVSSTLLMHAFDERRALLIPDTSLDHAISSRTSIVQHQIRSIACVPMIAATEEDAADRGEVVGLLQVHSVREGGQPLGEPELELLVGIGNLAAVAFQNAKSHQEQIQRNRQLEMIHQLEQILLEGDRFEAFTQSALQKALEALEGRWGLLSLEEGANASLQFASSVAGEEGVTALPRAIDWEGLIDDALESGETKLESRIRDESRGMTWSACAVPIHAVEGGDEKGRRTLGALLVVIEGAAPVSSADRALLNIFSVQISAALYKRRLHNERETEKRLTTIGRLSSSIIHDFGAPMTAIRGYAEILAFEADPENRKRFCQLIRKSVDRCVTMTSELLRFCRGEKNFRFFPVESRYFVQELGALLENEMKRKGVRLEARDDYHSTLVLDVDKMQRVLFNLSSNSLDVLKEGDHFRLVLHDGGGFPQVLVEDSGPGIPPEIRESLFDPFVTHGKKHGTGLGLAIAREIITGHRGKIRLDPTFTGGTRFVIDLDPTLEVTTGF